MLIPLGAVFSTEVLGAGAAGYGLFTTALGFGVAIGAVARVGAAEAAAEGARVHRVAVRRRGGACSSAPSSSTWPVATAAVFVMGVFVGPVYVLGFVLLQEEVDDELRGRVFSSLNTLVRLCVLVSMVAGPLLAAGLGALSESLWGGTLDIGPLSIPVPGVRLTLWLGALIIVAAGFLALHSVRSGQRIEAARSTPHPSRHSVAMPPEP